MEVVLSRRKDRVDGDDIVVELLHRHDVKISFRSFMQNEISGVNASQLQREAAVSKHRQPKSIATYFELIDSPLGDTSQRDKHSQLLRCTGIAQRMCENLSTCFQAR